MDNKKTALYIRLSDEDNNVDGIVKAESNSVSAQRILIRDYMQRNGLSNMADTLEYVDDGFSGTNFQRPAFQRMMDDAKQGKIGCIIVKDFSRFGRDHLETGNYLERIFPLLGIRFISVNDQFDSEDCMGMTGGMSVALKNIINSMFSRDLSKKVRSAMGTRAAHGEYMAAFAPYGYMKNPEDAHQLIPDEEAAEVVKMIFTMAAEGKKKPQIARFLNEQGTPTCMEHFQSMGLKRKSHKEKEKKLWTITTIGDMLKNEVYLGKTIWNKTKQAAVGSRRHIKNDRLSWRGRMNPSCRRNCLTWQMQKRLHIKRKMSRQDGKHSQSLSARTVGDGLSLPLGGMPTDAGRQRFPALRNVKQSMWTKSCLRTPYCPVPGLWRE